MVPLFLNPIFIIPGGKCRYYMAKADSILTRQYVISFPEMAAKICNC